MSNRPVLVKQLGFTLFFWAGALGLSALICFYQQEVTGIPARIGFFWMVLLCAITFYANWFFMAKDLLQNNLKGYLVNAFILVLIALGSYKLVVYSYTSQVRVPFVMDALYIFLLCYILFFSNFFKDWLYAVKNRDKVINLIKEKNEFEVAMLKSQFSPHFLFNTLNSIYAKCHDTSPEAARMIQNLSNFMRYLINDSSKSRVLVQKEIAMIVDFIDIYKLNHNSGLNISFKHKLFDAGQQVAPMLLLNFVENAFKHSHIASASGSFVGIELATDQDTLYFKVENNKIPVTRGLERGIGNKNTIARLELDYMGRYDYNVTDTDRRYEIELKIKL